MCNMSVVCALAMQCTFYIVGKQTTNIPHIQHEITPKICNLKLVNNSRIIQRKKHAWNVNFGNKKAER
jgi:hypothetical protein